MSPPTHSLLVAEQGLTPSWPPGPSSQPWAPAAAGPQAGVGRAEALQAFRQLTLKEMPSQVRFCPQKPFPCSAGSGTQAGAGRRRRHRLVLPAFMAGGRLLLEGTPDPLPGRHRSTRGQGHLPLAGKGPLEAVLPWVSLQETCSHQDT